MTPDETVCLNCGNPLVVDTRKDDFKKRFGIVIKYFMFGAAGLTALSLFVNVGVPFIVNVSVTVVLFLVQNSAKEMMIDQEEKK